MAMQIRRTRTPNNPPAGLLPGQLSVEMASEPPRLWVGVPTTIDPLGRREIGGGPSTGFALQRNLWGEWESASAFRFQAAAVVLRDAAKTTVAPPISPNALCTVTNIGVNGRDQTATFGSQWVHFYWIFGPALNTIASAKAPSDGGPTLPDDYTHWCYIGPVYHRVTSQFLHQMSVRKNRFIYRITNFAWGLPTTDAGSTSGNWNVDLLVSVAAFVPPSAYDYTILSTGRMQNEATWGESIIRLIPGGPTLPWGSSNVPDPDGYFHSRNWLTGEQEVVQLTVPNIDLTMSLLARAWGINTIMVAAYTVPNGAI